MPLMHQSSVRFCSRCLCRSIELLQSDVRTRLTSFNQLVQRAKRALVSIAIAAAIFALARHVAEHTQYHAIIAIVKTCMIRVCVLIILIILRFVADDVAQKAHMFEAPK